MDKLTEKQGKILRFISRFVRKNRMAPTVREIADNFGYKSPRTVQDHLEALKRKGLIEIMDQVARGIKVIREIPFAGYVQAGSPTTENFDVYDYITDFTSTGDELCALEIKGDSMKDAGILEGDIVIAKKNPGSIKNNDIVIAEAHGEVTVKYYYKKNSKAWLLPANRKYRKITAGDGTRIIGKVTSVVRKLI